MSSLPAIYHFLEESQMRTLKRYFSQAILLTPKRNELRLPVLFITTVFHRALASCCSRKIDYYSQCKNTSSLRVSSWMRPVNLLPTTFLPNLVKVQKEVGS
jgi:hypothetical protein